MWSYRKYMVRVECLELQQYAIQSVRADMPAIQPVMDSRRNACDYPGRLSTILDICGRKATLQIVIICRILPQNMSNVFS